MLSKTVEANELGKALSGIAIVAAVVPFATAPAFRELYKATIDFFPDAITILAGAAILVAFDISAILHLNKEKMQRGSESLNSSDEFKEKDNSGNSGCHDSLLDLLLLIFTLFYRPKNGNYTVYHITFMTQMLEVNMTDFFSCPFNFIIHKIAKILPPCKIKRLIS